MPSEGEAGGRTVAQDPKTEEYDLQYIKRIRARAIDNDRRTREKKARVISLCTQLINEFEKDRRFGLRRLGLRRSTSTTSNGNGKRTA